MPSKTRSTSARPDVSKRGASTTARATEDPGPPARGPNASPARVSHAVSALRAARAAPSASPEPVPMIFLIDENNSGEFQWTIVADGGEELARSRRFGSYDDAERAASLVHDGAFRATLDHR